MNDYDEVRRMIARLTAGSEAAFAMMSEYYLALTRRRRRMREDLIVNLAIPG